MISAAERHDVGWPEPASVVALSDNTRTLYARLLSSEIVSEEIVLTIFSLIEPSPRIQ